MNTTTSGSSRRRDALRRTALLAAALTLTCGALAVGTADALPDQRLGYGFNEGSGTAVDDTSANNTDATASSPTWTASGRYGSAIVFNGSSTRVRSTSTIALNSAFTLEAWVLNPSNQSFETVMSLGSDRDVYLSDGVLNLYTGSANYTFGTVATNTWQHVAVVSDGSTVRAYVEGSQQGSAQNAALGSLTAPLQVGSWIEGSSNSDFLSGTLDEVRVYNRALSATEIGTDRATPVSADGSGPDSTPPVRSAGQPSGSLPGGTTQTTLQLATNEAATCRYATTPGVAYTAMTNTFATTGGTTHSTTVSGLANGNAYSYQVRCRDTAGNANTDDFAISFTVAGGGGGGAPLGSWSATTNLPAARSGNGAVAANGFLYLVGGIDGSGTVVPTVYVAPVNANGTLGTWTTTTPVPTPVRSTRPAFYNGYLYVAGGTNGSANSATVYYARVNANGTLGNWATTTSLPQAQVSHSTVAYNGRLYIVGGNPGSCISTVRYATINANGTLGGWSTTSALPDARCGIVEAATVSNGRIYVVAGFDNSFPTTSVLYATVNANGTLGAWQTNATTLATSREYAAVEAANGYLFAIGGQTQPFGGVTAGVEQAPINANGSVGAFTAGTSLPGARAYLASELVNGNVYILGGGTAISGGTAQSSVWYAPVGGSGAAAANAARSANAVAVAAPTTPPPAPPAAAARAGTRVAPTKTPTRAADPAPATAAPTTARTTKAPAPTTARTRTPEAVRSPSPSSSLPARARSVPTTDSPPDA